MAEKQEPYTEKDFSELAKKLKSLGKNLTPKESAFLADVVDNARKTIGKGEVRGFGGQYDEKAYSPESYKGAGAPAASSAQISVVIKGHFVSQE